MKRKYLVIPGLCALVCIAVIALMGAAKNPEEKTVENLLRQRAAIMENMLFGKITYSEGEEKLKEVETGSLYNRDLENVKKYNDTDFEAIDKMDVVSLEKKGQVYDIMNFQGEIKWTYNGYDGRYSTTDKYQIGVSCKAGDYKLISLEIQ